MTDKILCLYHDHCTDGFGAAWAVRSALGEAVEFRAASYGGLIPNVEGRDVLIVDFSYPRVAIDLMAMQASSIIILDHHKTAQADLAPFVISECGDGRFLYSDLPGIWRDLEELNRPKIAALFDMKRSGAGITWDFFHAVTPRPWLIDLIEVRDLWLQDDMRWTKARALHAYLNSYTFHFSEWDEHARLSRTEEGQEAILNGGWAILRHADKQVVELVEITKRRIEIGGINVPIACLPPWMASDGGHLMGEGEPFAASYYDSPKVRAFSLRSRPEGVDVSAIAKLYGGGGHAHAAGFAVPRDHELAKV